VGGGRLILAAVEREVSEGFWPNLDTLLVR